MGITNHIAADAMLHSTSFRSIKPLSTQYSSNLCVSAIVKDLTFPVLSLEHAISLPPQV